MDARQAGARQLIGQVQEALESLYAVKSESRAEAFLVDRETALALGATGHAEEALLLSEDQDGLSVALYLDPGLLRRVTARGGWSPAGGHAGRALDDWCQVAEGVSHFLYLSWVADQERRVSLLELEAQAEVDKFALPVLTRWGEGVGHFAITLWSRLFQRPGYRAQLSPSERHRYAEANRLAGTYCARLLELVRERRRETLLNELRHGYRLGAEAKLHHLARRH